MHLASVSTTLGFIRGDLWNSQSVLSLLQLLVTLAAKDSGMSLMKMCALVLARELPLLLLASAVLVRLPSLGGELVLEDDQLLVRFDAKSGALTGLENKSSHWVLERRAELGASFRLLAPLPGRRDNFVLGQRQRAR